MCRTAVLARARFAALPMLLGCASAAQAQEAAAQPTDAAMAQPQDPAAPQDPAPAQDQATSDAQTTTEPKAIVNDGKWHFAGIGYVWFAGAKGNVDVLPSPIKPVGIDMSFGDILKLLKFAFMGAAEVRKDRLVFLGDLMWVHIGDSKDLKIRDVDLLSGKVSNKTLLMTGLAGYRVVQIPNVKLDLLAGGRINGSTVEATLSGPNRTVSGKIKKTWLTPVIAARLIAGLGGKWSATIYQDLGGVSSSNLTWQSIATLNYQVSRKMTLGAGYRYYKVKYETGPNYVYNQVYRGPVLVFRTDF